MSELLFKNKINIPFAQNGDKEEIPDNSDSGFVNNTFGLGAKYETPIAEGGEYFTRAIFNAALYKVYAAVKELQDIAVTAGYPIDMSKALNILGIENGGTGANTISQAKINFGLNNVDNTRDINKPISTATQNALNKKQNVGDYATNAALNQGLATKQPVGDYATNVALTQGLATKQPLGDYATNQALQNGLNSKQPKGNYLTSADVSNKAPIPTSNSGAGQIVYITPESTGPNGTAIVPSGGAWLVMAFWTINNGYYFRIDNYIVAAGGTRFYYGNNVSPGLLCWRLY